MNTPISPGLLGLLLPPVEEHFGAEPEIRLLPSVAPCHGNAMPYCRGTGANWRPEPPRRTEWWTTARSPSTLLTCRIW